MLAIRWQIAILLCLITTINYLDRQALAVAAPVIVDEFSLTNTQFGAITSAFLFAYAIGQIIVGPIIDRLGTKRAFSLAVVAWSLAGMLHAAARGFWSLLVFRTALGVTEAANFPAALKAVAEWFPKSERSLAVGIVTVGPGLGAVLAPPLLGWLITRFGWEWAFIVPGVAGLVWFWIWEVAYASPESHPRLPSREREFILEGRESNVERASSDWTQVLSFLRIREVWGLMLSRFVSDGAFYFFVAWLPLYLSQERGFDIRQIAFSAWIPFLAADVGSVAGGWLGTRLIKRGWSVNRSRKTMIWLAALVVPCALPAVTVESAGAALALIALAMFAIQFKAANLFSVPADLFPSRDVATIWGLFGAVGSFGGMLFIAAVGWVSENHGYAPVFAAVALMHIVSAVIVQWLIPDISQLNNPNKNIK
jgi:ACS family hexuronate transporter-like MFS transporter